PAATSSASRMTGSSQPGGAATTTPSTQSDASSRSRLSASSGRLRRGANAFGRSRPSRSPRPAAASTTQTLNPLRRAYAQALDRCRGSCPRPSLASVRADAGQDVLEPLRGLFLVHVLGVHELAREDLLRLDEHLLLA